MVAAHQKSYFSVIVGCVVFLGLTRLGSAAKQLHHPWPRVPGVCRSVISKVESYTESNLQSSLVGARGGICAWLQLNGCQQYKVVFTPVYKKMFRTVYVQSFVCCAGYQREGNACLPDGDVTVPPVTATTTHKLPDSVNPVTSVPSGSSDNDPDGSSSIAGFTGLFITVRPVTPTLPSTKPRDTDDPSDHTPQSDLDPPRGPRDKLLIILLILIVLVVLFAVASCTAYVVKHMYRRRPVCCPGTLRIPKLITGGDISDEPSKITCILSTINSDCSADSFRSGLSDRSHRSGSDQSGQSGLSSEVTFTNDSDSGIVKHVVYEKRWKDTTSLTSYSSSSPNESKESGQNVSSSTPKECIPLSNIPPNTLCKKPRPSTPIPIRSDVIIYDRSPHSLQATYTSSQPKYSSPTRQNSPSPYSYTSLDKSLHHGKFSQDDHISSHSDTESLVRCELDADINTVDIEDKTMKKHCPTYVNVKLAKNKKPRPVYVTLEPDTDSLLLATECCEDDDDPWMTSHSPASSSIGSSVGYCSLSNQVLPHRISGNGYDKLERNRQNFPIVAENSPAEYAVPSVTTSGSCVSCLAVENDSYNRLSRESLDLRLSGTMPSTTFAYLKLAEDAMDTEQEEERYIRTPRHNHKEMVFIEALRNFQDKKQNSKHNSLG